MFKLRRIEWGAIDKNLLKVILWIPWKAWWHSNKNIIVLKCSWFFKNFLILSIFVCLIVSSFPKRSLESCWKKYPRFFTYTFWMIGNRQFYINRFWQIIKFYMNVYRECLILRNLYYVNISFARDKHEFIWYKE